MIRTMRWIQTTKQNRWLSMLAILALAGCASEEWDNPRDPSGANHAPCPRVDEELVADCRFYEDFTDSLDRWLVAEQSGHAEPATIRTVEVAGESYRVAELQSCGPGDRASLSVEISVPEDFLWLSIDWAVPQDQDQSGELGVSVNGKGILTSAGHPEDGWHETFEDVDAPDSGPILLQLHNRTETDGVCSEIYVDSILLQAAP